MQLEVLSLILLLSPLTTALEDNYGVPSNTCSDVSTASISPSLAHRKTKERVLLTADTRLKNLLRMKPPKISATGVQLLESRIGLRRLEEISALSNSSIRSWLLAGLGILLRPGILLRKPNTSIPKIDQESVEAYEYGGKTNRSILVESYVEYINGSTCYTSGTYINKVECQYHGFRVQNSQWCVAEKMVKEFLDDVVKSGFLGRATVTKKRIYAIDGLNRTSDEVEIWTFQVRKKSSSLKELAEVLMNIIDGLNYGWINRIIIFVLADGFLSAMVITALPAAANTAGFTRRGIRKDSMASIGQSVKFRNNISGRSGYLFRGLQRIGKRGFLNQIEKLFVAAACTAVVLLCSLPKAVIVKALSAVIPLIILLRHT